MELNIYHLYPDVLNLYGDRGNVLCMQRRLEWRGMQANIVPVPIGVKLAAKDCDLLFIGGGQDFEQEVLLRDLASAHDYAFFSAPDEYMPSEIDRYPAAWLTPPRLKEVEGRRHGKRTYEIQLHLLQPGMRLTHAERARRLDEMEQTLLGIFTELTEDPKVICVERLSIRSRTCAFTNHGEISQSATAEAVVWF